MTLKGLKMSVALTITFIKPNPEGALKKEAFFNSDPHSITHLSLFDDAYDTAVDHIISKIGKWTSVGSGWVIDEAVRHSLSVAKYRPFKASSYLPLAEELSNSKKGLINIQNKKDNECFRWCHLAHKFPVKVHPERITKYKTHVDKLDYSGMEFPVKIKDVPRIERQNNISINVFTWEEKAPVPIYILNRRDDTLALLIIHNEYKSNTHFVLIRDYDRFCFTQTKHQHRKFFCRNCLNCCSSRETLEMLSTKCKVSKRQTLSSTKSRRGTTSRRFSRTSTCST